MARTAFGLRAGAKFATPPAGPNAAERAKEGVSAFFSDEANRKAFVSAALIVLIAGLAAVFLYRRAKKRKAREET